MNIYQLVNDAATNQLTSKAFKQYLQVNGQSIDSLYNHIATSLTKNYLQGNLDFNFCDRVMNQLNTFAVDALIEETIETFPEPADSIYLAFDEGEFHHSNEDRDLGVDPAEKYTKPMLVKIISEIKKPRLKTRASDQKQV